MNKPLALLPLLILLFVASAGAGESPKERAILDEIQQVLHKLQAVDKDLRGATEPEVQERLTADVQALRMHLAQLQQQREALRLARVEQEKKARLAEPAEVQPLDERDLGKHVPDSIRLGLVEEEKRRRRSAISLVCLHHKAATASLLWARLQLLIASLAPRTGTAANNGV